MSLFSIKKHKEKVNENQKKKAAFWIVFQEKFGNVSIPDKEFGTLVRVESGNKVEESEVREDEDWKFIDSADLDIHVKHKDFDQEVVVVKEAKDV